MKNSKFIVAIVLIALLSAFFGAGGTKTALAETAFLDDVAGIAAYTQVTAGETFLADAQTACPVDEFLAPVFEVVGADYFICSVAIEGYASAYAAHVFVHNDGWIMAYYLEDEPAAKMLDVIAQPLVDPLVPTSYPTLLEQAVGTVGVAVGIDPVVTPIDVSLYDFSNPLATDMLFVAEDKAEDLGELGDDDAWFTIAMPAGSYYEISYAFYQNYYPLFSLDGVNFVNANADYIGGAPLGTIYGDLDATQFIADESYLFEVDTFSLAPAGYGALLITFSGVTDEFVIDSADWVEAFALVAAPEALTALFDFDFAPVAFGKVGPTTGALQQPTTLDLSWGESLGATSYEYCIYESADLECDTWISTGADTSVTLSGLPYNATYFWQVRALNSYETTYADTETWWSFSTITGAPAAFGKISPTNGLSNVPTSPILDWTDADGADYYEYCVVTNLVDCTLATHWVNTGLVSQAIVNLDDNEDYSWQVHAVNTAGVTEADDDVSWSFTTVTSLDKVSPANGTTGVDPRVTLMWDSMLGADSYQYCVDTTNNNACNRWVSAEAATEVTVRGLKYSTTYYWQVRAVTALGTTEADDGVWWTFTTRDRNAPPKFAPDFNKVSPTNGATDQLYVNLVLDWEDVAKVGYYEYCIQNGPVTADDPCTTWVRVYESTATIEELSAGTTYYWQVRAEAAGIVGYADGGVYWSFTTITEPVITP
jgi:hypothetical protein